MSTAQRAIEHLLLVTGASRAILQRRGADGTMAIAAEAVQHGQQQLRHTAAAGNPLLAMDDLAKGPADIRVDAGPAGGADAVTSRMRAPIVRDGTLVGVVSLHQCGAARAWTAQDRDAVARAAAAVSASDTPPAETLRSAAIQAVLDGLRPALDIQRCTFRQPVEEAYAFPVVYESRDPGQRSLLGDFTIVQTGQPVIVKLLAERAQVIQDDCSVASQDPLFHKMLAHYGGMRAQMVTPFIVGDQLKGVLSVHELRNVRVWTAAEKALAAKAAALIGALSEVP